MDKHRKACQKIAKSHVVSPSEVKQNMQEAIDEAWNNPNETIKNNQLRLFPNGKPTVEELIDTVTEQMRERDFSNYKFKLSNRF